MQERTQPFAPLGIEDLMGGVRPRGFGLQRGRPSLVKIVDGVANGLVVAAKVMGYRRCRLPFSASQQHLAAAYGKA